MRQKTLISPRSYAVFDLECKELEGKYEIKPNPFLTQGEPNIWIDNFVLYNMSVDRKNEEEQMKMDTPHWEVTKDTENEFFDVEVVTSVEQYRNWVPKKKGFLPVPPKSDFICSPAEVSAHRKVKLQSKPVMEDTIKQFEELCECFPEVFSKNSEDIGRTNLITMDIDTGDHPPICQKPYRLALKHYEWVQKEVDQLEWTGIITRSVSP